MISAAIVPHLILLMHRLDLRTAIALLATLASSACVHAPVEPRPATPQRPFLSPNAFTTPEYEVELDGGLTIDRDDALDTPIRMRTGVGDHTELFGQWSPRVEVDRPGDDESGVGDVRFGIRRRILDQDEARPAVAVQLEGKLATADEEDGLGTGGNDFLVSGIFSGHRRGILWNGAYRLGFLGERGGGLDLEHALALSGALALHGPWSLLGEISNIENFEQDTRDARLLVGARYDWLSHIYLDASYVLGLTDDAADHLLLFGLSANVGRWR